ncbi:peroxiredoxin-6 [Eleutherodactylus coqui]|uniref:peroxiredoxin-6 n=1 Tax=Eleutherodactylus coqui TaxID=57060 RepID=UPI0034632ABD
MGLMLGDTCPDFTAETQNEPLKLYEYTTDCWFIICSHPGVYTPVCTTEIAEMIKQNPEFAKRNVKLLAMSFGSKEDSKGWIKDICSLDGGGREDLPFPLICDQGRDAALKLGFIKPDDKTKTGLALTARHVMICDKDKKIQAYMVYSATSGRSFSEILRVLDSLLARERTGCSCPVNWQPGDEYLVPDPTPAGVDQYVTDIRKVELPSGKSYIKYGKPKQ